MIEEIKKLRIKIDGLAQLTKNLRPQYLYKLDLAKLPDGWDVESWLKVFKEKGFAIEDSFNQSSRILKDSKLAGSIIESIPQIHKEIDNAANSLYLAKAWLGKMLGELGEQTPYQNDGKRKSVKHIEEASDKATPNLLENMELFCKLPWSKKSHIEKVDWLREEIKIITETVLELNGGKLNQPSFSEYQEKLQWNTYTHLSEARFWLGFELQRIKENESSK